MKKLLVLISYIILVSIPISVSAVLPYFSIRSQAEDAARELAGWAHQVNLCCKEHWYGSFSITPEYSQSFNNQNLANCLFGLENCNNHNTCITISGSRTANRNPNDWLADYFYLPTDYKSNISFNPTIKNAITDLNLYLGLDEIYCGLFFRVHLPITWTQWNLNFCEQIIDAGTEGYDAGYVSANTVVRGQLLPSFSSYAMGNAATGVSDVQLDSLQFAQIDKCSHEITRLAELQLVLGLNFINAPAYHFGAGIRMAAPSGSRPKGEMFFEPMVGNGKHWEFGAQFTGHAQLYARCNHELGIYSDLNITHLFRTNQRRTFDLKGKPFSRYMLAEKLSIPVNNELAGENNGTFIAPSAQFKNEITPVANLTNQNVLVSVGAQFDLAIQLTYAYKNLNWDLGYEVWGKSGEKICRQCDDKCIRDPQFVDNIWALKGDAWVFGYDDTTAIALSASQSKSTIFAGTDFPVTGATTAAEVDSGRQNLNVDNSLPAFADAFSTPTPLVTQPGGADPINTSVDPIFITFNDIDFVSNSAFSQKFYTHISYISSKHNCYNPYVGIGGFAELGRCEKGNCSSNSCATTCDDNCSTSNLMCSISQWGVWMKVGISFE